MAHNGLEVLIVEDNPGDVDLVREALESRRTATHISAVSDGEEALAYLHAQGPYAARPMPQIVLLDLNLPKLDGREVLRAMKADPVLKRIPVIVLTSSEAQADIERAYALNANCFVVKPGDLDKFLEVVREIERFWRETARLPMPADLHAAAQDRAR